MNLINSKAADIRCSSLVPEALYKKCVLKNFTKFTAKHLCRNFFSYKVAGLKPEACNFIKKE